MSNASRNEFIEAVELERGPREGRSAEYTWHMKVESRCGWMENPRGVRCGQKGGGRDENQLKLILFENVVTELNVVIVNPKKILNTKRHLK